MKTRPLGRTGVEVSALCLGAMFFGSKNDKTTSYTLLDQYVDAGGTFIDSANIYAHWVEGFKGGESETLLGEWMRERGNRDQLFIATKVGFNYPGVEQTLRASVIQVEAEKSLKRLGVDSIDLYYAHVDDYNTPLDESLEAFDRLVQAGKVRYIAASNYRAWRLEQAKWTSQTNGWAEFCAVQQRYSYLRPRPGATFGPQLAANDDLFDYSRRNNFTVLAYSAMLGGAYTRPDRPFDEQYRSPDNDRRFAVLRDVAQEVGATASQTMLAWMLHSDVPTIPLIAASTADVMADNLGALDVSLTADQMQRLDNA
jgi:aryl-alcohol dehydrogenase-like predicted oxidoreductase